MVFYLASLRIIDRASALDPEEARYRFLGTYADCSSESDLISALDTVSESGSRIMRQLRDKSQSPAKGVKILFLDLSIRTESPCGTAGDRAFSRAQVPPCHAPAYTRCGPCH